MNFFKAGNKLTKQIASILVIMVLFLNCLSIAGAHFKLCYHFDGSIELIVGTDELLSSKDVHPHHSIYRHDKGDGSCHESPLCCNKDPSHDHIIDYVNAQNFSNKKMLDFHSGQTVDELIISPNICQNLTKKIKKEPQKNQTLFLHETICLII